MPALGFAAFRFAPFKEQRLSLYVPYVQSAARFLFAEYASLPDFHLFFMKLRQRRNGDSEPADILCALPCSEMRKLAQAFFFDYSARMTEFLNRLQAAFGFSAAGAGA